MSSSAIAFVRSEDEGTIGRVLGARRLRALRPASLASLPVSTAALAVIDPEVFGVDAFASTLTAVQALGSTPVILFAGPVGRENLAHLVDEPNVVAVVARDVLGGINVLAEVVERLVVGPRFGFADERARHPVRLDVKLASTADRSAALEGVAAFAGKCGARSRVAARLVDATEELITNALYDAPTDLLGNRPHLTTDRREAVDLGAARRISVSGTATEDEVTISVRDPFGSLDIWDLKRYLARGLGAHDDQIDFRKRGGAGLGFARVYANVDRVVAQVEIGIRSEVSLVVGLRGRHRDVGSRPSGLLLVSDDLRFRLEQRKP